MPIRLFSPSRSPILIARLVRFIPIAQPDRPPCPSIPIARPYSPASFPMRLIDDEADLPAQINIVPMIDVIFAILTFFVMSSLYLTKSQGLPVNLPKAATAQQQNRSEITITVDAKGQVALNRQPAQARDLPVRVRALMGKNKQALVIVNADERVSHGKVVAIMDQLRTIPGVRMAISAQRP
jgi:biopolymer transport protein ExbD